MLLRAGLERNNASVAVVLEESPFLLSFMHYRKLGRSGLKVSELCLGTMQFGWTTDERPIWE